jgi:hypothetical protein
LLNIVPKTHHNVIDRGLCRDFETSHELSNLLIAQIVSGHPTDSGERERGVRTQEDRWEHGRAGGREERPESNALLI